MQTTTKPQTSAEIKAQIALLQTQLEETEEREQQEAKEQERKAEIQAVLTSLEKEIANKEQDLLALKQRASNLEVELSILVTELVGG